MLVTLLRIKLSCRRLRENCGGWTDVIIDFFCLGAVKIYFLLIWLLLLGILWILILGLSLIILVRLLYLLNFLQINIHILKRRGSRTHRFWRLHHNLHRMYLNWLFLSELLLLLLLLCFLLLLNLLSFFCHPLPMLLHNLFACILSFYFVLNSLKRFFLLVFFILFLFDLRHNLFIIWNKHFLGPFVHFFKIYLIYVFLLLPSFSILSGF